MIRAIVFAVLTAGLAYLSSTSLRAPRSHGFYRFFAWELILALFFLNFESFNQWFGDPFSPHQLVSWLLLAFSLVPLVQGAVLLRSHSKPGEGRHSDSALIGIEKTTRLVTTGIYRHIRHPLYSSLLLLAWGVFFKKPGWLACCLAVGACAFLLATAKAEEDENTRYFGTAYREYMRQTKMFIPFIF
jgi:protein-S-isoprenylcysteine O-methyltransferase Ste14